MKASAISLMVCNFNQERASARIFCTPAICFALKQIIFSKQTSTSLHIKNIKLLSRHECLLITWTNALLSVKKKSDDSAFHGPINADSKQSARQCLDNDLFFLPFSSLYTTNSGRAKTYVRLFSTRRKLVRTCKPLT